MLRVINSNSLTRNYSKLVNLLQKKSGMRMLLKPNTEIDFNYRDR